MAYINYLGRGNFDKTSFISSSPFVILNHIGWLDNSFRSWLGQDCNIFFKSVRRYVRSYSWDLLALEQLVLVLKMS